MQREGQAPHRNQLQLMFQEHQIRIPKKIAGLMCSAILSDTLLFRSPTCTPLDRKAVEELAKIAGIDPQTYAMQMFSAGSDLQNKSDAEVFYQDFKKFSAGDDYTDGLAETLRAIDTTEVSFVVKEVDTKLTKVSMRSKKADVAQICSAFGGGGHTFAAGCTIKAGLEEAVKKILKEIKL